MPKGEVGSIPTPATKLGYQLGLSSGSGRLCKSTPARFDSLATHQDSLIGACPCRRTGVHFAGTCATCGRGVVVCAERCQRSGVSSILTVRTKLLGKLIW